MWLATRVVLKTILNETYTVNVIRKNRKKRKQTNETKKQQKQQKVKTNKQTTNN